jgi:hypothetical protein
MQWIYKIMNIWQSNEKPNHWKKKVMAPTHKDANCAIMTEG